MKTTNNNIFCDICGAEFAVTPQTLTENEVILFREGSVKPKPVTLTWLQCPHCGKRYVCLMDDQETVELAKDLRTAMAKRLKFLKANKPVPERLAEKTKQIQRKLDFKRQKLADEYNGSFYQTEDGKEQLDYKIHHRG